MQLTPNFRLRKPDGTDPVDVQDFNDNADVIDTNLAGKLDKTGDASNVVNKFTQAGSRANLTSGEKLSLSLGKIMKVIADLKGVAFSGSYSDLSGKPGIPSGAAASCGVANNDTTTASGFVADARIVKIHGDEIDKVNQNLGGLSITVTAADNSLQSALPTLYNTARDKGYLDRHNRTFHVLILNSSGAYMGDWNGYFSGDSTAIYGNAYSINLDSTYQFRTGSGGADAVLKKLGEPTYNVIHNGILNGSKTYTFPSYGTAIIICAGVNVVGQSVNKNGIALSPTSAHNSAGRIVYTYIVPCVMQDTVTATIQSDENGSNWSSPLLSFLIAE